MKQAACNQGNHRKLCAAGDKGGNHNGDFPVFFALNGTAAHNSRDAAAGGYQKRNKGLSGQAKTPKNPVHDKRNSRHISAVLQQRQKQEQNHKLRHKADDRSHAADEAVHNQANQPRCGIPSGQQCRDDTANRLHQILHPLRRNTSHRLNGYVVHPAHNQHK